LVLAFWLLKCCVRLGFLGWLDVVLITIIVFTLIVFVSIHGVLLSFEVLIGVEEVEIGGTHVGSVEVHACFAQLLVLSALVQQHAEK
jgi:hypothetical protein